MGTSHPLSVGSNNHAITANPNATGAGYADIAARDADSAFNTLSTNVNKVVRVDSPLGYHILTSIAPTWHTLDEASANDEWTELTDTPAAILANLAVQGNAAGTALVFGQDLRTIASPTFAGLTNATSLTMLTPLQILKPATAVDTLFALQDSAGVEKFGIKHDVSMPIIEIKSPIFLDILTTTVGSDTGNINISAAHNMIVKATRNLELLSTTEDVEVTSTLGSVEISSAVDVFITASNPNRITLGSLATPGIHIRVGTDPLLFETTGANTVPIFTAKSSGANGSSYREFASTVTPVGAITGNPGDKCMFVSGVSSASFIHRGASANNTDWIDVTTGAGDVLKVGTPLNDQVGVWTGDGTIEGTIGLKFDSTLNNVTLTSASGGNAAVIFRDNLDAFIASLSANNNSKEVTLTTGDDFSLEADEDIRINPGAFNTITLGGQLFKGHRTTTQITLGTSNTPDVSAVVEVASTIRGFLQPRQTTTQRDAITSPAAGLSVYNTITNTPDFYNGTVWKSNAGSGDGDVSKVGTPVDNQVGVWTGDGTLEGDAALTFDTSTDTLAAGSLVLTGDLTVQGTTTTLDTTTLLVEDKNIELGNVTTPTDVTADGGGITLKGATDKTIVWSNANDRWDFNQGINVTSGGISIGGSPVGNVTKVGTPVDNQVGVWTGDGTLEGDADLTFDGSNLTVNGQVISTKNGGGLDAGFHAHSNTPAYSLREMDASADNKLWHIAVQSEQFRMEAINDAADSFVMFMTVDRTGTAIDAVNFPNGPVNITNDLIVDTDTLIVDASADQVKIGNSVAGLTDLTIFQNSANLNKGLSFSGTSATGPASTTEGVTLCAGFLGASNNQLWVTNKLDLGNASKNSFRYIVGPDVPLIVGVNNDGSANKSVAFGLNAVGAQCGFGFPVGVTQAEIQAQVHIQTGVASLIGLIVEAEGGQTADLVQIQNNSGVATSVIDAADNWGIGTVSPNTKLHALSPAADTTAIATLQSTGTNPGVTATHVGDRDPSGNVTAAGGAEYIRDSGNTSGSYENLSATTGTVWRKRTLVDNNTVEINTSAEFEALATAGVITLTADLNIDLKQNTIVSASRFALAGFGLDMKNGTMVYVGSGTFISGTGAFDSENITLVGTAAGTLADFTAGSGTDAFTIERAAVVDWGNRGTVTGGIVIFRRVGFVDTVASSIGFSFINNIICGVSVITNLGFPSTTPLFTVFTNSPLSSYGFDNIGALLSSTGSILDYDAKSHNLSRLAMTVGAGLPGTIFKKSALSDATISSVADAPLAAGTITAQADNGSGGTTHSSTTTYFNNEEIAITGTTSYNGTFQIFNVVAGVSFDTITAFVANDAAGSVATIRLELTLAGGHGVSAADTLKIVATNFYNGFSIALNVATNVVTINETFIATDTGTIERGLGLDETDPRVKARENFGFPDSEELAFGKMNGNTVATTGFADQTYQAIDLTSVANNIVSQRFRLTDAVAGIYQYIGTNEFNGEIGAIIHFFKAGSSQSYRIAFSINGAIPVFATADYQPADMETATKTITMLQILSLQTNDTFQIMAAPDGTTNDCTFSDVSITASS